MAIDLAYNYNKIGEKGMRFLCLGIEDLRNLNTLKLDLTENNIGDNGLEHLSYGI